MTAAGGAGAAVLDRQLPTIAGIESKLIVGAGLTMIGVTELAGDYSDEVLAMGSGMLAVTTYQMTTSALAQP